MERSNYVPKKWVIVFTQTSPNESSWCVSAPWTVPALLCPHNSTPPARQKTIGYPLIQPGPWELLEMCVAGMGPSVVIIYQKWEQEWTAVGGATALPHFSEWNYSTYIPPPCSPRTLSAGPWLVVPPSCWRQADSLVDGSARKSTHSASHKRSDDTEEEEMQAMRRASLAQHWWRQKKHGAVPDCRPYLNWYRASPSPYLDQGEERREHICITIVKESQRSVNKVRSIFHYMHVYVSVRSVRVHVCVHVSGDTALQLCYTTGGGIYLFTLRRDGGVGGGMKESRCLQ